MSQPGNNNNNINNNNIMLDDDPGTYMTHHSLVDYFHPGTLPVQYAKALRAYEQTVQMDIEPIVANRRVRVRTDDPRPQRVVYLEMGLRAAGYDFKLNDPPKTPKELTARIKYLEANFAARDVSKEKNAGCRARIHALETKFFAKFKCTPKTAPLILVQQAIDNDVNQAATYAAHAAQDLENHFEEKDAVKKGRAHSRAMNEDPAFETLYPGGVFVPHQLPNFAESTATAGNLQYGNGAGLRESSPAFSDSTISSVDSAIFEGMDFDLEKGLMDEDVDASKKGDEMDTELD